MLVPNGHSRASLVVRLKGGDPYVFGRGGEEASALAEAGVPFEVVPGVTSALAAPSYAGVPATDRRYAASFHVLTGHRKANGELGIDFDALVRAGGADDGGEPAELAVAALRRLTDRRASYHESTFRRRGGPAVRTARVLRGTP